MGWGPSFPGCPGARAGDFPAGSNPSHLGWDQRAAQSRRDRGWAYPRVCTCSLRQPTAQTTNPKPHIPNPKPKSHRPDPKSRIPNPASQTPHPSFHIPHPRSQRSILHPTSQTHRFRGSIPHCSSHTQRSFDPSLTPHPSSMDPSFIPYPTSTDPWIHPSPLDPSLIPHPQIPGSTPLLLTPAPGRISRQHSKGLGKHEANPREISGMREWPG